MPRFPLPLALVLAVCAVRLATAGSASAGTTFENTTPMPSDGDDCHGSGGPALSPGPSRSRTSRGVRKESGAVRRATAQGFP